MVKPSRSISLGDERHLLERGGDQPAQPDDVHALPARGLQDLGARHHHAEVDDLVVVALQHDAHDVLADVVDVALHGGQQHPPVGLRRRPSAPAPPRCTGSGGRRPSSSPARSSPPAAGTSSPRRTGRPTMFMPGHERPLDHLDRAARPGAAPPRCPRRRSPRCLRPARAPAARAPAPAARRGRRPARPSWPFTWSATASSRSVASARRLSTTSSTRSSRSAGMSE